MHKSNWDAFPQRLNHGLHAIDATPARWRGRCCASSTRREPRYPTHWLIYAQVYANFHVHAAGRTIAGARQSAADVAERNFKAINRMKNIARRNCDLFARSDAPMHARGALRRGAEGKVRHLAAGFPN